MTIRKLSMSDASAYTEIGLNAYTGLGFNNDARKGLGSWVQSSIEEWEWQDLYGFFDGDQLIGEMCLFEFDMNLNSVIHKTGGIGGVAVDLLHKKEKVARDLIQFALGHYRDRSIPVVTLYPFNLEFYKRMGFGHGAQVRQYKVKPTAIPLGPSKSHLEFLGPNSDRNEVLACYDRFYGKTNGMAERFDKGLHDLFNFNENRLIGFRKDGQLQGYLAISFERHYDFKNDLVVKELVYETPQALQEFMTFLHTQADQFGHVIFNTQDESLHLALNDPCSGTVSAFDTKYLETSVSGVGIMYRIVDVAQWFTAMSERNFNGQTCSIRFHIDDDFLPENAGEFVVSFEQGMPRMRLDSGTLAVDGEMRIGIAEFSSLVMGVTNASELIRLGLASVGEANTEVLLNALFYTPQKPMCWTHF